MSSGLDPLEDLREQFRAAAIRDAERSTLGRKLKRHRRGLAILAVALVGSTGLAAAVDLISVGTKRPGNPESARRFGLPDGRGIIAVTAPDPGRPVPWAVVVYRSDAGKQCAIAGQLRASDLGEVRDGTFHPFLDDSGAACGDLAENRFFADFRRLDGRLIVFGRANARIASIEARYGSGMRRRARVESGGAFLFVFDGGTDVGAVRLAPVGR